MIVPAYDQNQLLQALLKQNELLTQLLTTTPTTSQKPVPVKSLTLKAQLKQDFKTAFHKKWGIES